MSDTVSTISGLSSGIQWRDLLDQISAADRARALGSITTAQASVTAAQKAWNDFRAVAAKLSSAATALAGADSLRRFTAAASTPLSGIQAVRATATAYASPGSFAVEVRSLATAAKLGSGTFDSATTALGISGTLGVNGRSVNVSAGDSLSSLRDKFAAANGGDASSGVGAAILRTAAGYRLILTSEATGRAGIDLIDDAGGTLAALGFTDGTASANLGANGAVQSARFRSASASVSGLLGMDAPAASTILAAGSTIAIDVANDSLNDIVERINAALGDAGAARVVAETIGGTAWYRIESNVTLNADPSGDLADSARALTLLGAIRGGQGGTAQVVQSSNAFGDVATGLDATGSTLATDLAVSGSPLGVAAGDTFRISGRTGDGRIVAKSVAITSSTTVDDILAALNSASDGFGSGTRTASASLVGGRITLTDGTAGESQLALTMSVEPSGGGAIGLGSFTTGGGGQAGSSRVLVAGTDAEVWIDGQRIQGNSNTVTDAVAGVTLSLLGAAPGEPFTVSVGLDTAGISGLVREFTSAYNALRSFVKTATASGGSLANNTTIRAIASSLTSNLTGPVVGLDGSYTTAAMLGMQHDANGVLTLNEGALAAALATDFDGARAVLSARVAPSSSYVSFEATGPGTKPSATPYDVNITQAATLAEVTGATWANYSTAGTPDTMTILDAATGKSANVELRNGDGIATVAARLNAAFASSGMRLAASVSASRLKLESSDYGSTGGFTVAYVPGTGDGTASLGIAARAYSGLDVAGSINGTAATGRGQVLTGAAGDATDGLALRYTGTTTGAMGTVRVSLGVGGVIKQMAEAIVAAGAGSIDQQLQALSSRADGLSNRASRAETLLAARRAALTRQFVAMEAAMAKAQSLGLALSSQFNAMQK